MVKIDCRTRKMMMALIEKPTISYDYLQRNYSMNRTQIEYTIDKINQFLSAQKLPLSVNKESVIRLPEKSKEYLLESFLRERMFKYYEMSSKERGKYIFLTLFYYEKDYLSVNHFLDALKIGKTTFMSDLRKLQAELHGYDISISYSRKEGYHLAGDELMIRYALFRMILEDVTSKDDDFIYRYFIHNERIQLADEQDTYLSLLLEKHAIELVENRLIELNYILIFLYPRMGLNEFDLKPFSNDHELVKMKEYRFAEEVLENAGVMNSIEKNYLCGWVLGMALGNEKEWLKGNLVIIDLVERIVERFELLSGIRFKDKHSVIKQLYSHFRPTYFRMLFRLPIINPMQEKIFEKYNDLYQIVKETLRPISDSFDSKLPDEEVAFLTMHFALLIRNSEEYMVQQKVGVVVCPNGIGSSAIIYNELKEIFPSFILLGPIETSELHSFDQSYDIIFTTKPNFQLYPLKKPIFVVNPIMSYEERTQLFLDVKFETSTSIKPNTVTIDGLMQIIQQYSTVTSESALRHQLEKFVQETCSPTASIMSQKEKKSKEPAMLLDMMRPELIQLNKKARTWEEAFYLAANPLIERKIITRNYIDSIIQQTRSEGAYMVIFDQVALPHTVPEAGAKKLGMGLTTLESEVYVLGTIPVKYIFTLSALDSKQHLNAMTQFITLIESKDFFRELEKHECPETVYHWFAEILRTGDTESIYDRKSIIHDE
ncbi:BglG family transcription antiterminator [Enterococcus casseliflavus]|uniref:BglG family transcription antiterminator n=1 Tax=Enterococcus casseliflavus TaxID=37734 RepID=UPI0039A7376E